MPATVAIRHCPSYDVAIIRRELETALDALGGWQTVLHRGDRVLLKPNLLFARPPEQAVTTHPAVVEAVGQVARDCGTSLFLSDNPPYPNVFRNARKAGLAEVAQRVGIEIIELRHPTHTPRREPVHTREISTPPIAKTILDFDVILNLPKVKAHQQMALTGGVKNLFGCVVGRRKAYWHFKLRPSREAFAAMLLGLYERIAPELTIADGIVAMQGQGPGSGTPFPLHRLLVSPDALAMDCILTEILRLPHSMQFLTQTAKNLGFPNADLEACQCAGLTVSEATAPAFTLPTLTPIGFSLRHIIKGIFKNFLQSAKTEAH